METKLLKLVGLMGLVALLVWIGASAIGKRDQVRVNKPKSKRRAYPKSVVWNKSPVEAPYASAGLLFSGAEVI